MDKQELLKRAKSHCFFIGLNDSGAELSRTNSAYGMASIHFIQERLGMPRDATFISTPDLTITRNTNRWRSGFGYGGKISWGSGDDEVVILNVKPNACGMLVGGIDEMPDVEYLIKKVNDIEKERFEIDGIEVEWDFYKSNHFIDIFEIKKVPNIEPDLPNYAFIIHGSSGEFSGDNKTGFGMYYDKSKSLMDMSEPVETPFGTFHILTGNSARKYFEKFKATDKFSKKKRKLAAELLFGDYKLISNETHQGLISMNEITLGCHHVQDNNLLYPLTLRSDLPAYLVKGKPNLSEETIEMLGFHKRAEKLEVYDRLTNANIIPHGGGYVLPDILTVNRVLEVDGNRYFEVDMHNDRGIKIISEVRELPYEYRGRTVVLRSLEVDLIDIAAKLVPRCVFKI